MNNPIIRHTSYLHLSYPDPLAILMAPSVEKKQVDKDRSEDGAERITIRRPDDMHVHLRDGVLLDAVARFTASEFARAVVMPNIKPPVRTLRDAHGYFDRIKKALPFQSHFIPLMTLYLTDDTTYHDIEEAYKSGLVKACKLYPAGATTNSSLGVTSIDALSSALTAMQTYRMVLCVHGEVTSRDVDIFDREASFISSVLPRLLATYPTLKIVLEHVTTSEAVNAVLSAPSGRLAASVTAHHLLYSRQALFEGAKLHPHMFCLPVLKREAHRQAILRAIAGDDEGRFFAGTDSAPHPSDAKISTDCCAGIFSAHNALALYTEAFDEAGILHRLERFLSINGSNFYGLPLNEGHITLEKRTSNVLHKVEVEGMQPIIPLRAGKTVSWTIIDNKSE